MPTLPESVPLTAGSPLETYVIERLIAQGRYGFSYLAQDASHRECLIREFLPHEFAERIDGAVRPRDAEDRTPLRFWMRSFLEKSTQISRLVHPALPQVLRQFEANGTAYEVSAYEPGETLQALFDTDGKMAEATLVRILRGVCGALETVHAAGLLHRDVCPEHIWLRDSDGTPCLREFGMLRAPIRMKARVVTGVAAAPYAAPEDDGGATAPAPAADLYALGVIAYRALSGNLPPSAAERRNGVAVPPLAEVARVRCSPEVVQAIEQAMQMAPERRPVSISAWRESLAGNAADLPASAPVGRGERPRAASGATAAGPRRFVVPAAALVAVGVVGYLLVPRGGTVAPPPAVVAAPAAAPAAATADSPASPGVPAPATTGDETSLDRLALELIARERKLQEARDAQRTQEEHEKALAAAKLKEAETRPASPASPSPTVIAAPAAPSPATLEAEARTRALEAEVARLRAESEARQRSEDEAAKARAQAASEKEAAAQNAEAERTKQAQAIALARKKCPLPAMDLSEGGNLNYYNALQAPGARKTASGSIRLPPVELGNGKTAVYEITPDSCANLVR